MKKRTRLSLVLLTSFFFLTILRGQPVNIEVLVAPPIAANISDYLDQSVLKITNVSTLPVSIMLKGTLASNNGINGRTKDGYRPLRPIVLAPNVPIILQASKQNRIDFLDLRNLDYTTGPYNLADIARTGVVPEGTYEVCIAAYDYTTGLNLLSKQGAGFDCRSFNVVIPQPPIVDCDGNVPLLNGIQSLTVGAAAPAIPIPNPISIRFNWLPTNANGRNLLVAYDLYLLKLMPQQNGQDALNAAIRNRQNNPIFFRDIRTPQYNLILATTPSLVTGHYAWAVVGRDGGGGQTVFQNNGISQICEFEYTQPVVVPPPPAGGGGIAVAVVGAPVCGCKRDDVEGEVSTEDLKVGDMVEIGAYKIRVNTASKLAGNKWKGTGNIKLPIMGQRLIPVLIDFTDLSFVKIGDVRSAKTGIATGQRNPDGPSLAPHVIIPDKPTLLPVKKEDLLAYDAYYQRNKEQVLSNLKESFEGSGIQLPFGIDGANKPTIGIVNLSFTPKQAWFDAIAGMDVTDEIDTKIAFGAAGVCLKTTGSGFCGDALLYMAEDLDLKAANLKLFGARGRELKDACHLIIKDSDVDSAKFVGEYAFSQNVLRRADGKPEDVKVLMTFTARSWSSWFAYVTMPDFKLKGAEDFTFSPKVAYYDHTDTYNPAGMPGYYTEGSVPQWQGFFMPDVKVTLPPVLKKGTDTPTEVKVSNMLIDKLGLSAKILADNIVDIRDGNLDGWAYSLDHIDVEFLKSTFKTGKMNGKLMLPLSKNEKQSELDYNALLSYKNDSLKYTFNVAPKADIQVPMWVAKLDINQNSNIKIGNENAEKKFHAEAHLYGQMSVNSGDLGGGLPKFDLAGIKFENLYLKNYKDAANPKDDYVGADKLDFVSGFASPPKTAGGFPLSITSFKFKPQPDANATFAIEFKLAISDIKVLPEATGEVLIKGKIGLNAENRLAPEFVGIQPTAIFIKGKIGPINVDGGLKFFNGDATYGDGIYGKLTADLLDKKLTLGGVACQFGSKNGKSYWFIDAMVGDAIKNAIPSVEIYRLGGGAYYNMSLSGLPDVAALKVKPIVNADGLALGKTLSGTTFTPTFDGKMGFRATAFFGVIKKEIFNADASMTLEINTETGGISRFIFDGKGRYLETSEGSPPLAGGSLFVDYDAERKIFAAAVGVQSKVPIPFSGKFYLYFAPIGWHVKLGRPESVEAGAAISVELLPAVTAKAYFQVGNYQVDAAPPLPDFVIEQLKKVGIDVTKLKSSRSAFSENNPAIAFGASITVDAGGDFGPIYGSLKAMAGFDLSLEKIEGGCAGQAGQIGIDGWYANGQFYAAINAKLGIHIDLGFFDQRIQILEGAAAAAIVGGGPNPFWGRGGMGIYIDLLGIIKGNVHYEFAIGTPCIPAGQDDAVNKIEVIAQVKPESGKVDVDEYPSVAFNFKVGQQFTIDQLNDIGEKTTRTFCFFQSDIGVNLKNKKANAVVLHNKKFPINDRNAMVIIPQKLMDATADHELTITAAVSEYFGNGLWKPAKRKNGEVFSEVKTVNFTTNDGLETIKPERLVNYNPVPKQRFFTPDESRPIGFLEMGQGYALGSFNTPRGAGIKTSAVVKFVKLNGTPDVGPESPISISGDGRKWDFVLPSLDPSQVYVAQVILRWTNRNNTGLDNALSSTVVANVVSANSNAQGGKFTNYNVEGQQLNAGKLSPASNEKIVYAIPFRSSQYPNYATKLANMKLREIAIARYENSSTLKEARIWFLDDPNPMTNLVQKVKTALDITGNTNNNIYPQEYNFWIDETFDESEVIGHTTPSGFKIPPRIAFVNNDFNDWQDKLFRDIQKALLDGGAGKMWNYIGGTDAQRWSISTVANEPFFNPAAPLLSDDEAKGLPFVGSLILDPMSQMSRYYLNRPSNYGKRAMLTMTYATYRENSALAKANDILGKLDWAVNPANQGFQGLGKGFNVAMNGIGAAPAANVSVGVQMGGVSKNIIMGR